MESWVALAALLGYPPEHLVLSAPCVMTDRQLGTIHKVDPTPLTTKPNAVAGRTAARGSRATNRSSLDSLLH